MLYSQSPPLAENDTAQEEQRFARDHEDRGEPQFGRRPLPPLDTYPPMRPRRSLGRRMFRALSRFVIVLLLGIGGTLGWQAYGDMAKQMVAVYAPEQAWLLAYLPSTKPPAAVAAAPAPVLQLEPLASNLELVRRSVEQLAVKQEQMARNIAAMQAVDEDIRKTLSQPPAAPAQPPIAAAPPPPKPVPPKPQPAPGAPTSSAPRATAPGSPVSLLPR